MYKINYNNYLMHHGVKGMKWGVRHDPVRTYAITKNPPSGYTVKDPLRGEQYRLRSKDSSKNKKIERKAQRAGRRAEYQYNKAYKRNATKKQSLNEGLAAYERKRNELERKEVAKSFSKNWGIRKTFQARKRYNKALKSGNVANSKKVENKYASRLKSLDRKVGNHQISESSYFKQRHNIIEKGRIATKRARLLDAGYSKREADIGAKWAAKRGWTIGKYDEGWSFRD